jgi:methyl coenzyme M reductase subunit D
MSGYNCSASIPVQIYPQSHYKESTAELSLNTVEFEIEGISKIKSTLLVV